MSKTLEEKIDGITWLALFMILEPVKRVASPLLYPLAYALRHFIYIEATNGQNL